MKILDNSDVLQANSDLRELKQLNSLLWYVQEILSEGKNEICESDIAEKLRYIYVSQRKLHKHLEKLLEKSIVV